MSRFIVAVDNQGQKQRLFADISVDNTSYLNDYIEKLTDAHHQVIGRTHYFDINGNKAIICLKSMQAKKAWGMTGLDEELRPIAPWIFYDCHDENMIDLFKKLAIFYVFGDKNT